MKVLLVRLGSLGDIVHTLPVAAALREADPGLRLDWLVDARYASILDIVPVIDSRIVVAPAGGTRPDRPGHPTDVRFAGRLGLLRAVAHLRRQRYDAAIDMQGLIKSAVLSRASGARRVIGFDRADLRERQASLFYTETCPPAEGRGWDVGSREPEGGNRRPDAGGGMAEAGSRSPDRLVRHVIEKNLSMLPMLGVAVPDRPSFPLARPVSPALDFVRRSLEPLGVTRFALLNPGAAWPNKRWPAERFGAVASALRARHGLASVVCWGPGEEWLAEEVAAASGGGAIVAPSTQVGDLLSIARAAAIVVSGDTGPLHLAAAVGAPIVAVFGPTDPARNGPWDTADITLSRFADCVCHYERRCRRNRPCLDDITVEDVLGAISRRLAFASDRSA
jgi:ADP-heptose:LPS heptosyltransferase